MESCLKAILLFVARLLFVAVYAIGIGLFTGWLAGKIYERGHRVHQKHRKIHSVAA
jgi:hypothetical protein